MVVADLLEPSHDAGETERVTALLGAAPQLVWLHLLDGDIGTHITGKRMMSLHTGHVKYFSSALFTPSTCRGLAAGPIGYM